MRTEPADRDREVAAVAACVSDLAVTLADERAALLDELFRRLSEDIEQLRGDRSLLTLLATSIEGNVDNALHVLRYGIAIEDIEVPTGAVEYARRLAQHDVPVHALVRAYRLGQDSFLGRSFALLNGRVDDPRLLAMTAQQLTAITFAYIDRVTEQVLAAYQDERERWLRHRNAARESRLRQLLRGEPGDPVDAETTLGYPLRGRHHLGMVVWAEPRRSGSASLERAARAVAERLGVAGAPLVHPVDQATAWVWIPLASRPSDDELREATSTPMEGVMLAVGETRTGVEGFRRTHESARQAQDIALAAGANAEPVVRYADVGPVVLLCHDLEATKAWVGETLGRLALDDDAHRRLRDTLRVFLAADGSYAAAGEQLTLHRNTVHYRVRKAEEERGRPIERDRLSVELALAACRWLGPNVLTRAS